MSLGTQTARVRRDQDCSSIYPVQESPSSVSGLPQPKPLYYPISYTMFWKESHLTCWVIWLQCFNPNYTAPVFYKYPCLTNQTACTIQSSTCKTKIKRHTSNLYSLFVLRFPYVELLKKKKLSHTYWSAYSDISYYDFSSTSHSWCLFYLSRY